MKYYLINGSIRDGEHEYSKLLLHRAKSLKSKQADEVFVKHFSTGDYRIVKADYFQEIPKVDFVVLKKYL